MYHVSGDVQTQETDKKRSASHLCLSPRYTHTHVTKSDFFQPRMDALSSWFADVTDVVSGRASQACVAYGWWVLLKSGIWNIDGLERFPFSTFFATIFHCLLPRLILTRYIYIFFIWFFFSSRFWEFIFLPMQIRPPFIPLDIILPYSVSRMACTCSNPRKMQNYSRQRKCNWTKYQLQVTISSKISITHT